MPPVTNMVQHLEKVLVANRGEIAVRIIRTAQRLGLATIAIYTPSDALAPHVSLAWPEAESGQQRYPPFHVH